MCPLCAPSPGKTEGMALPRKQAGPRSQLCCLCGKGFLILEGKKKGHLRRETFSFRMDDAFSSLFYLDQTKARPQGRHGHKKCWFRGQSPSNLPLHLVTKVKQIAVNPCTDRL